MLRIKFISVVIELLFFSIYLDFLHHWGKKALCDVIGVRMSFFSREHQLLESTKMLDSKNCTFDDFWTPLT